MHISNSHALEQQCIELHDSIALACIHAHTDTLLMTSSVGGDHAHRLRLTCGHTSIY